MTKKFDFGFINYEHRGGKNLVTVTVELKENKKGLPIFSVTGDIWNTSKSDILCGGQCLDEIAKYIHNPLFNIIYGYWKKYHLNDMHAGTPEQERAIEQWKAQGNRYDYTQACEYLKSMNLYEVDLNNTKYKYGYAWVYEAIPENDLKIIKEIMEK